MENSEPVLFAHATRHPEKIDRFFPLSHFGKKEAALDIIKYTMERKKLSDDSGFHIEDVYLCMKNPLMMPETFECMLRLRYPQLRRSLHHRMYDPQH